MNTDWVKEAGEAVDRATEGSEGYLLLDEMTVPLLVELNHKFDKIIDLLEKRTRLF